LIHSPSKSYGANFSGSHVDKNGTYVTTSKAIIITNIIGIIALIILSNGTAPIVDATNKLTPSGGVTNPIARFITSMIPKWIGSIPIFVTTGKSIGVKITIAEIVSINIPTINNNKLIIKIIIM